MNIYEKLNAARAGFHGQQLKKSGLNKFANYTYFELGDFIIPALQVFKDMGLCAYISFGQELATMRIVDVEKPEQSIEIISPMSTAALKGCHEVQNLGAVQTYLRRYLWVAALEIVEHDALDGTKPLDGGKKTISATDGSPDEAPLNPEDQQYLRECAVYVSDLVSHNEAPKAKSWLREQNLDDQQETYLWAQLGSKTRSTLKAA